MLDPLLIATVIGWLMSVCVHEYAHALSAYLAGDHSVAERGYLSMNPLSYLDPVTSIVVPLLALVLGGIPLPGGAVLIDKSRLRKRWYASLVAAAGPAANLLLFLFFAALIHPRLGFVDPGVGVRDWPAWAVFVGTMAYLQVFAVALNLLPIPPLDGFQIVGPLLKPSQQQRLADPQVAVIGLLLILFGVWMIPGFARVFFGVLDGVFETIGIPPEVPRLCYQLTFHG